MTETLNQRQNTLLQAMSYDRKYALSDLLPLFKDQPSAATLRRDLSILKKNGYLATEGEKKGTRYWLTVTGLLNTVYDPKLYCDQPIDTRGGKKDYFHHIFEEFPVDLFSEEELEKLDHTTQNYREKLVVSDVLAHKELERFVIELSWKSSRIEGNTYSLWDTERLLKEGKEATGHPREEAVMILNHKKAFDFIMENLEDWKNPKLRDVEDVHRQLVADLNVNYGLRKGIVGVLGSSYHPLSVPSQIREELEELLKAVNRAKDVYSKALFLLVGISYIQGFEDGNKRTARLCTNAILVANKCAPLSYRSVEEDLYKRSMLVFYEKQSLAALAKIFLEQYQFSSENYLIVGPN